MISTRMTIAIMAACFFIAAQADLGKKCKFNKDNLTEEDKKNIAECYKEVTGKTVEPSANGTCVMDGLPKEEREKIGGCVAGKMGIIGADGTLNAEKAKEVVAKIDADEDVKKAIIAGIDACAAAGGDLKTVQGCLKGVIKKECAE